jgi:hypothetical protein
VTMRPAQARCGVLSNGSLDCRRACEVEPHSVVALQAWGRLEGKLRNLGEARRLFGAALELEPTNEYALQVGLGTPA